MKIINKSNKVANLAIGSNMIKINPNEFAKIQCDETTGFQIFLDCGGCSYFHKGKYILLIKTLYMFPKIHNNCVFEIVSEKIRVNPDVFYERLFLSNCEDLKYTESYTISGEKEIKQLYEKKRRTNFFLIKPFEHLTGLTLLLIIVGILLSAKYGVIFLVCYFPLMYLFLLSLLWLSESFCSLFFKKVFKIKDEKFEFYRCFENEFIVKFYSGQGC